MTHPPPLRLGFLGAGAAVRKLHHPALAKLGNEIELAGVWSRSPEKARALADDLCIERSFADYRELLADPTIEAVLTAVPIELNASLAIAAIEAGKHVLAEKPIAATVAEARRVLDACSSTQRVVAIAENFRYREDILEAKRLIESGLIGRVQCFQMTAVFDLLKDIRRVYMEQAWRQQPEHAGGLVVDAGVHAISGLREILGDIEQVYYARLLSNSPATSGPDGLVMQLGLTGGAAGQYLACYTAKTDRETVFDLSVYGEEGSLWFTEAKVEWFSARTNERATWQASPDRGYVGQWMNFLAAVRGREAVYSTPAKAYDDLLVLECALTSAASGRPVQVGKGAF